MKILLFFILFLKGECPNLLVYIIVDKVPPASVLWVKLTKIYIFFAKTF